MFEIGDILLDRNKGAYYCVSNKNAKHPLILGCVGYELTYVFSEPSEIEPFRKKEIFTTNWVHEEFIKVS